MRLAKVQGQHRFVQQLSDRWGRQRAHLWGPVLGYKVVGGHVKLKCGKGENFDLAEVELLGEVLLTKELAEQLLQETRQAQGGVIRRTSWRS
jgi:hypothetical protein